MMRPKLKMYLLPVFTNLPVANRWSFFPKALLYFSVFYIWKLLASLKAFTTVIYKKRLHYDIYEVKENCTVRIKRHTLTAVIHDGTCWFTVINTIYLQHHRHM